MRPRRVHMAAAAAAGAVGWALLALALPALPEAARFVLVFLLFVAGPGLALARFIPGRVDALSFWILAVCSGLAAAPFLAQTLGMAGVLSWFPYVACVLGAAALASSPPRRAVPPRGTLAAALGVAALAVALGATAYAGRLQSSADSLTLYGEYDSFDTTYYAAVSSEVAHRIPPLSPYHAGHRLNYSYYPHLVLGLVARFASVPLLNLYFTYAWTVFLAMAALGLFALTRELTSSTKTAVVASVLFMVGSDFSYLVGWTGGRETYLWDHLIWSTNFFSPSAETLYFNTFTPAMAVVFAGLYAMTAVERDQGRGWLALAIVCFASLAGSKPFAFAVVLAALGAATLMPHSSWASRRRYVVTAAAALLLAAPFLYQVLTAYGESHSKLVFRQFVMPATALEKLALYDPLRAWADGLGLEGAWAHAVVLAAGTVVFFAGGLGVRLLGVPELWRRLRAPEAEWRIVAWCVVSGVVIPFVIATEPYHQTLHFYQTALFLMPIFVAAALGRLRGRRWAVAVAVTLLLAVPSTAHYLYMKRTDHTRPMSHAERGELAISRYLARQSRDTTVILHDRPEAPSLVAVLSERRVVLAWSRYVVGSAPLALDIRRFFNSADGDEQAANAFLTSHRVTHVIEDRRRNRIHPAVLDKLRFVVRYGDIALYETVRR